MSGPERSVRASDDDRERVALELGRQAGAGRLTAEELDERLEAAYAAGADGSFWPIWVILGCGVGVVREGFRAYGPGTEFSDEELGLHERARRRRLG